MGFPFKRAAASATTEINPNPAEKSTPNSSDEKLRNVDVATAIADLDKIQHAHQWDPNLPRGKLDAVKSVLEHGNDKEIAETELLFTENSPYEEVRAAVRNTDGGEIASTLRAWILGMIFVTLGSGLNMLLSMRSPQVNFPALVVVLLVYPIGCLWAKVMPTRVFNTFGVEWTLNPGPFTIKEHVVVTLMSNVSIAYAYSTDALLALQGKPFYNLNLGWGFALIFTLSSQLIGIALSGMFRRFLIWPSAMLWPTQFAYTSLFYALHDKSKSDGSTTNGWVISRYRYFFLVTGGMFCYYWIPGVIWQGLSVFAFVTWIRPNNVVLNQLFGGYSGLSLLPITFDWTYVSAYLYNPLLSPTQSHVNTLLGVLLVIIASIGIAYTGALYGDYLPLVTSQTYDNTQSAYDVSKILGEGFTLDVEKYHHYSPLFLSPSLALNYGLSFAALTASIVHIALFHGKEIWYRFKTARNQEPDIHLKLMKKYPDAPEYWYLSLLAVSLAFGLACVLGYDSQLPWWGFLVSVILAFVFVIPTCMIMAMSNIVLSLNVIAPFIAGFLFPGRPIGVMVFKVFSTITLGQAQTYGILLTLKQSSDLKMAHYMKIPPRLTFWCQVVASIWAVFVQIAVMNWTLGALPEVCSLTQASHFSCPNGRAFFSASIVWGVLGPERMFGPGSMYVNFNWFWLIGAGSPVIIWFLARKLKIRFAGYLHAPICFGSISWLPPATPLSFSTWALFGLLFNYYIRKRWNGWWCTYNYVTSAALDAGLILSTIVVFFAITLPGVTIPQWWGNVDVYNTVDASITSWLKTVPEGGTFGPATWK
ncbi:OPT family small oligopeptide transporter [Hypoxylon sp. FL1284]|nr:OPT family small oligopeptide transporter [Hypoxylon sp. FL1284]